METRYFTCFVLNSNYSDNGYQFRNENQIDQLENANGEELKKRIRLAIAQTYFLIEENKHEKALKIIQNCVLKADQIELDPNNVSILYNNQGYCLLCKNNLKLAYDCFITSLEILRRNAPVYNNLACFFYLNNDYEQAKYNLKQAIEINGLDYKFFYNLGIINENSGSLNEAKKNFKKSREINSNCVLTLRSLTRIYQTLGKNKKAFEISKRAHKIKPDDIRICIQLANLAITNEEFHLALEKFQMAQGLPENANYQTIISEKIEILQIKLLVDQGNKNNYNNNNNNINNNNNDNNNNNYNDFLKEPIEIKKKIMKSKEKN
ncbi:lipopolysaccharide assembly protein b [Anaeramoeba flamelloides]|uniref:Lipopolysaccharide assembly protein b n=1 Tax=Anaeramoeba flamelloides TaxID=1746091 RepID=A0ABQ8YP50_9EUKA|nr:lipopolysaccharide assembly protein b [Anaeramoeba flamelloides]